MSPPVARFLRQVERWRATLTARLAARSRSAPAHDVDVAAQCLVLRLVFLRLCEDRGLEPADELMSSLRLDDRTVKDILRGLHCPDSAHELSALPPEILGHVHEQFLGKVVRLTPGHGAKVKDRPEVRKASGVYYTPAHIVDYIVKNAVGKLLERKTPAEVEPVRILDPACGSGAFLLGAYQYLLDWHRDWYVTDGPEKHADHLYQGSGRQRWLTIPEKKRILLNNVYGVDIDPQAVEITKLALVLKVLDGETNAIRGGTHPRFLERVLSELSKNIKCGNALIGPDFYERRQPAMTGEKERRRINAFDWAAEFPDIFPSPEPRRRCNAAAQPGRNRPGSLPAVGFDAVIGNPPYLSFSGRQAARLSAAERTYFSQRYGCAGWLTTHGLFIELSVKHLARQLVAFVVPDQVGHLAGYEPVRRVLCRCSRVREVRYWGEHVFPDAVTPALTFISDRAYEGPTLIYPVNGPAVCVETGGGQPWISQPRDLLVKVRRRSRSLGKLVGDPGVHSGNCAAKLILASGRVTATCVPVLEGRQVFRYRCDRPRKMLRLSYAPQDGEYFTIRGKHRYAEAQFVIRQTASFPIVGPREHAEYFRNSLLALYAPTDGTDVRYLVGLLNSRLLRYVYGQTVPESRQQAFPQVKVRSLRALPIRPINLADAADREQHDGLVALVRRMLEMQRKHLAPQSTRRKATVQRRIDATDRQIDQLVFELYELTPEEIEIVKEATR